jgi:hypothetical protein
VKWTKPVCQPTEDNNTELRPERVMSPPVAVPVTVTQSTPKPAKKKSAPTTPSTVTTSTQSAQRKVASTPKAPSQASKPRTAGSNRKQAAAVVTDANSSNNSTITTPSSTPTWCVSTPEGTPGHSPRQTPSLPIPSNPKLSGSIHVKPGPHNAHAHGHPHAHDSHHVHRVDGTSNAAAGAGDEHQWYDVDKEDEGIFFDDDDEVGYEDGEDAGDGADPNTHSETEDETRSRNSK